MEVVTVSSKYQVVIPRGVRESLRIAPGQKLHVLAYGDRVEFIPVRRPRQMRGFPQADHTTVERDRDRV